MSQTFDIDIATWKYGFHFLHIIDEELKPICDKTFCRNSSDDWKTGKNERHAYLHLQMNMQMIVFGNK